MHVKFSSRWQMAIHAFASLIESVFFVLCIYALGICLVDYAKTGETPNLYVAYRLGAIVISIHVGLIINGLLQSEG